MISRENIARGLQALLVFTYSSTILHKWWWLENGYGVRIFSPHEIRSAAEHDEKYVEILFHVQKNTVTLYNQSSKIAQFRGLFVACIVAAPVYLETRTFEWMEITESLEL